MQVDVRKLRGKMAEAGMTQKKLASMIQMNPSTFSRKMHSLALDFSIGDMHRMAQILGLSSDEAAQIFLQ